MCRANPAKLFILFGRWHSLRRRKKKINILGLQTSTLKSKS